MATMLTKKEMLMPTWGRVLFALIPAVWTLLFLSYVWDNEIVQNIWDGFGISLHLLDALFVLALVSSAPFQVVLDPIGWWSEGLISGPTEEGLIVVMISYMAIFYFLFPAKKPLWQKIKRIFGST